MSRTHPWGWGITVLSLIGSPALAESPVFTEPEPGAVIAAPTRHGHFTDDIPHPDGEAQARLREQALRAKLQGKASGRVHQVAKGQFVELGLERQDRIFVVLAEFGDEAHPAAGTPTTNPGSNTPGPLHNQIAQPDRTKDNSTIWQADYSAPHYRDLYFSVAPGKESVKKYYEAQSSGRYTVDGFVTDWVKVRYNGARYGHNMCGSTVCSSVWDLVNDAIDTWTAAQVAAGRTPEQIKAELDAFDQWDRYDYDRDGDFNEPDGYIDHFQIVHAGAGEETGGGAQGPNAIWSHRWYAYRNASPDGTGPLVPRHVRGGVRFGSVDKWVGDYTIQPENGGLGVFAHEYGHDLGLPDQYDTTNRADNGTGFWSIMSAGSYLGDGTQDIGSRPGDMFAWDKFQLGWLDYDEAHWGVESTHKLGPAENTTKKAQAVVVHIPYTRDTFPPFAGGFAWYSGAGNNLDNSMTRTLALPTASSVALQLRVNYQIESGWDYAYVSVSTNGGATFTNLANALTTTANPNNWNLGNGITGASAGWVATSFDLTPYAGQTVQLRIRYRTDTADALKGLAVDELAVVADGATVFSDGAEAGDNGWTLDDFTRTAGTLSTFGEYFYFAEYRQYRGYDATLKTGPYNFGFSADGLPDQVEHYPYQDGLLITLWNRLESNNNVFTHPGSGRILPIDAHPTPLMRSATGTPWSGRVQNYDATFGLQPTDAISLKTNGTQGRDTFPSLPAVRVFDDRNDFWFASAPYAGTKVPKTGTVIEVINTSAHDTFMQVRVRPATP